MIDEKKLIEQLKGYKREWKLAEPFHKGVASGLQVAIEATKKQPKVNEWIPVSEQLPKMGEKVLCSLNLDNPTIIHLVVISTYDDSHYWHNGTILAWMPLPSTYDMKKKV